MSVWTAGVASVLALDERRLRPEQRARDWLPSTRDATVLGAFLCGVVYAAPGLLIHFLRTRRWPVGLGLGLLVPALILAVDVGVQIAVEATVEWLRL